MRHTKAINLFAGPGAGKSTTAAGLFNLMKTRGERVELVTEYAKELTYEGNFNSLNNQMMVLGEQFTRLHRLVGHVDWVITDSPLPLGTIYAKGPFKSAGFTGAIMWAFETFDNVNFYVRRTKPYQAYGRSQTEFEAVEIDARVTGLLNGMGLPFTVVDGDLDAPYRIYEALKYDGR